jgi:multicomponent Na+:H+ antiporter subunit B
VNFRWRKGVFFLGAAGFFFLYGWGARNLPGLGHYPGPYGDLLNSVAVYERHATDVVTAVNFDYRGFDTLGEESILFASVMGCTLLLRKREDDFEDPPLDHEYSRAIPPASDAVRVCCMALVVLLVVFGLDIVLHGQLTPGGGFQGGVILASVPLIVYLGSDYKKFEKITNHTLTEALEGLGIALYALIGYAAFFFGLPYLTNIIPLGKTGDVNSTGTIAAISFVTGMEVTGGIVLLMMVFFEQALVLRKKDERVREELRT